MKLVYNYFTYNGDESILLESVMQTRRCIGTRHAIVIHDDGNNKTSTEVKLKCLPFVDDWKTTTADRCRNLNGGECIHCILASMDESILEHKANYAVKIDVDTAVINAANYIEFLNEVKEEMPPAFFSDDRGTGYGCFYALNSKAIKKTVNILNVTGIRPFAPEDTTILGIVREICKHKPIPIKKKVPDEYGNNKDGIIVGVNWATFDKDKEMYKDLAIVTFGNKSEYKGKEHIKKSIEYLSDEQ